MNSLVLIHNPEALMSACQEVSDLFAFRRRYPRLPRDRVLALWLDPQQTMVAVSGCIRVDGPGDGQSHRIAASASLSGLWTLCWLEESLRDRVSLLEWLASESTHSAPNRRFIPVFDSDMEADERELELMKLRRARPDEVRDPLYQDRVSSRLVSAKASELSQPRGGSL